MALLDKKFEEAAKILCEADDEVLQSAGMMALMRLETLKRRLKGINTGRSPLTALPPNTPGAAFGQDSKPETTPKKSVFDFTSQDLGAQKNFSFSKLTSTSNSNVEKNIPQKVDTFSRESQVSDGVNWCNFLDKDGKKTSGFLFSTPTDSNSSIQQTPLVGKKVDIFSKEKEVSTEPCTKEAPSTKSESFLSKNSNFSFFPQPKNQTQQENSLTKITEQTDKLSGAINSEQTKLEALTPKKEKVKETVLFTSDSVSKDNAEISAKKSSFLFGSPSTSPTQEVVKQKTAPDYKEASLFFNNDSKPKDKSTVQEDFMENILKLKQLPNFQAFNYTKQFNSQPYTVNNVVLNVSSGPQHRRESINSLQVRPLGMGQYSAGLDGTGACGCRQIQCGDRRCGCNKQGIRCGSMCLCSTRGSWCLNR